MATYLGKAPARLAIVADDQITSAKIVDNTVTSADILNATITGADLASDIVIDTTGTVTTSQVNLGDNEKAYFGASNDLQIYHDGTQSWIRDINGSSPLLITSDAEVQIRNSAANEYKARFISNGAVMLYYDHSKKFETTSTGATVTGSLNVAGTPLTIGNDNIQVDFSAPEGRIQSKNSTASPASNLGLYTTDTGGTTNKVVHINYQKRVGINTASPTTPLHIVSSGSNDMTLKVEQSSVTLGHTPYAAIVSQFIRQGESVLDIVTSENGYSELWFTDASSQADGRVRYEHTDRRLEFFTAAVERLSIDCSGYVGIGISNPDVRLDVYEAGNTSGTCALRLRSGNAATNFDSSQILLSFGGGAGYSHSIQSRHQASTRNDNAIDFYLWKQGTDSINSKGTLQAVTIEDSSTGPRLGINTGTSGPTQDLDILNANGSNVILRDTSSRALVLCGPATGVAPVIGTTGTGSNLLVSMNGNNCFTFTAAGCLGVNTITPFFRFHVCNGSIGFDDGTAIRHEIHSIGHQVGIGYCSLSTATADCGNIAFGSGALQCNDVGQYNVAVGYQAMLNTTSAAGSYNTAHGYQALYNNTTGEKNTAIGYQSMYSNTTGEYNAAIGTDSLRSNTIGQQNVALGHNSLYCNTEGFGQVAAGYKSLFNNTTGDYNVALGAYNLEFNTTGSCNVAVGYCAFNSNTIAVRNVGLGYKAGAANTTGNDNVAIGTEAFCSNLTGYSNIAVGSYALAGNTTGQCSVAIGPNALRCGHGGQSVAIGINALFCGGQNDIAIGRESLRNKTCGWDNVAVGYNSGCGVTTGYCNVAIGPQAMECPVYTTLTSIDNNVAIGKQALRYVDGHDSVGIGSYAFGAGGGGSNIGIGECAGGCAIRPAYGNVYIGVQAGRTAKLGCHNIAIGFSALSYWTNWTDPTPYDASNNIAIGCHAMRDNTTGGCNIAIGLSSLSDNTTGVRNIAIGSCALLLNTTGAYNIAIGYLASCSNTTGCFNTTLGCGVHHKNISGSSNTILGYQAGWQIVCGNHNIALGTCALKGGSSTACTNTSIAIGNFALCSLTTGSSAIAIGYSSQSAFSGTDWYLANISLGNYSLSAFSTGVQNIAMGTEAMRFQTNGCYNLAIGSSALRCNLTGNGNIAIGSSAMANVGKCNNQIEYNIAIGNSALSCMVCTTAFNTSNIVIGHFSLGSGAYELIETNDSVVIGSQAMRYASGSCSNIAIGSGTLYRNTTGYANIAIGKNALNDNTIGIQNTAIGYQTMYSNTTGEYNVAIGKDSLYYNTTGCSNIAVGLCTLHYNSTGKMNVAIGECALRSTTSSWNIGIGAAALKANIVGTANVAVGYNSLGSNTTGYNNVAVGGDSLKSNTTGTLNTGIGDRAGCANTTGRNNVFLGYQSGCTTTTGINNIVIGYNSEASSATVSNEITLGNSSHNALRIPGMNVDICSNNLVLNCGYGWFKANSTGAEATVLRLGSYVDGSGSLVDICTNDATADEMVTYLKRYGSAQKLRRASPTGAFDYMNLYSIGSGSSSASTTRFHMYHQTDPSSSTAGTEDIRLATGTDYTWFDGGNVGIGTKTPVRKLQISNGFIGASESSGDITSNQYNEFADNSSNWYNTKFHNHAVSPASHYMIEVGFAGSSPDNGSAKFFQMLDTTTARVNIDSDGDIYNHDGTYGTISDERIKQNIVDAGSQWDDIKNIRVRKYKKKHDVIQYGEENAPTEIGVISQELEAVSPGLIKEDKADSSHAELHEDFTGENPQNVKYVKYSILYMKSIKALQEAMERIETLEAEVAALKNQP